MGQQRSSAGFGRRLLRGIVDSLCVALAVLVLAFFLWTGGVEFLLFFFEGRFAATDPRAWLIYLSILSLFVLWPVSVFVRLFFMIRRWLGRRERRESAVADEPSRDRSSAAR